MMKKNEFVKELVTAADRHGVVVTLFAAFGGCVSLVIPYSEKAYEVEIDTLALSVRAVNSLKRAGLFTLGGVVDAVSRGELSRIRNLGKKTENEIKTKIMAFGYEQLTGVEKIQFFQDVIEKNKAK